MILETSLTESFAYIFVDMGGYHNLGDILIILEMFTEAQYK